MPLQKKQKPTKHINIGLTGKNEKKLDRLVKHYGLSQQEIVNVIIRDYKDPEVPDPDKN